MQNEIVSALAQRVGADVVTEPDAQNVARHTQDFGVRGDPAVGILAPAFPRTTHQVATILKFCHERRIAVQPQGGMTGHTVPESDIEKIVYEIASRRKGSISAEHGIGSLKREFLHYSRSPEELALMRTLKKAMDPNGILNPGKIFQEPV